MPKYVVVKVYDRSQEGSLVCDTLDAAVAAGNEFLLKHLKDIGYEVTLEDVEESVIKFDCGLATAENLNAWCNIRGDWDAYIVPLNI